LEGKGIVPEAGENLEKKESKKREPGEGRVDNNTLRGTVKGRF